MWRPLSWPKEIPYQYPDRGDKVEEILFPTLQASMLSTLVTVGQRFCGRIALSGAYSDYLIRADISLWAVNMSTLNQRGELSCGSRDCIIPNFFPRFESDIAAAPSMS